MNRYENFIGKVLDGRYKIIELVGVGGMACVLKAQDLVMNRVVAIKILNDEYNGNKAAEERFIDESKAVAMLSHKNIVSIYDVAIYPDIKYIVMEYLDGITLREYLDNKGALPWKEASIYILQILRALEHAHGMGVVHRDIKPQNVMLLRNGEIKVTDFGIAKLPDDTEAVKSEKAVGTVYYISPEQACGKETDYYSDIYSVGVMFYEAVTGSLPFVADTPLAVAMMQVNDEPANPRDLVLSIPVGVSQIILKAMEKSPSERFTSAHSMAKAIEWVLRNPDVIFSISSTGSEDTSSVGSTNVVSIDMIDTAEIQPYGDDEIADSLGKKRQKASSEEKKSDKNDSDTPKKKKKKNKKKQTSRSMFPIIAGVTFSFLLIAIVLGATIGINVLHQIVNQDEPEEVLFPNLIGEIYNDELKSKLANKSYGARFEISDEKTEIIYTYKKDLRDGEIVETDPVPNHSARPDENGKLYFTSITVNYSKNVVIPDLIGYSKSQATTILDSLQLKYTIEDDPSPENSYYFDGQVTKTLPAAGEECHKGETVTISVCQRADTAKTGKMPNCIGMTKSDAVKFAETYALYKVTIVEVPTIGGNGRVISQSIPEGTITEKGTEVNIVIAAPLQYLPDLKNKTKEEADIACNLDNILGNLVYFKANSVCYEGAFEVSRFSSDISQCSQQLLDIGCMPAVPEEDTGKGVIVYQSLPPETEITEETKLDIIIVIFDDSFPIQNGNPFQGPIV